MLRHHTLNVVCHSREPCKMKQIQVKNGQVLQRIGDLNTKVYKVESGLLRSYSIDDKGKEHIFLFTSEGRI